MGATGALGALGVRCARRWRRASALPQYVVSGFSWTAQRGLWRCSFSSQQHTEPGKREASVSFTGGLPSLEGLQCREQRGAAKRIAAAELLVDRHDSSMLVEEDQGR